MISRIPKVRIALTRKCNMRCDYCPRGPDISMENYDGDNYCMSKKEIVAVAEILIEAGVQNLHLTGGEPLLRPDIVEIVKEIKSLGADIELNTNGLLLNSEKANDLEKAGVSLLKISLDAPNSEHFKELTNVDGYQLVLSNIKAAISILPVRLNSVLLQKTKGLVFDLIDLADEIGAHKYHLLDLTYYPSEDYKTFWQNEFVNLTEEIAPLLSSRFGSDCQMMGIFGCNFSKIDRGEGRCTVVLKEADMSMRASICMDCSSYCHEGIFTLRVSAGGYLSICPNSNQMGVNAKDMLQSGRKEELLGILGKHLRIFQEAKPVNSFPVFLDKNSLFLSIRGWKHENMSPKL